MIDVHRQAFKEEAYEILGEMESSLLELEERLDDVELIGRIFRAMHTIKMAGSMFGFDDIAAFTHQLEAVFEMVRNGRLEVTKQLINRTLAAKDKIKTMLDAGEGVGADLASLAWCGQIITGLKALAPHDELPPRPSPWPET